MRAFGATCRRSAYDRRKRIIDNVVLTLIMVKHNLRLAGALVLQSPEPVDDLALGYFVEIGCRLVGQQGGFVDEAEG